MSTTIKYKGNILATLENESISLKTANKFAEADVEINAVGGNPDGKTYQDKYKYVVLEDGEDEELEPGLRYVKQNGTYGADQGKSFRRVEVDVDQVRDYLEDELISVTDIDLNGINTIGPYAFYGRTALMDVEIPEGVTNIGTYAFSGTGIRNLVIPKNVINIGTYAFYKDVELQTVEIQGKAANASIFRDCTSLTSVKAPLLTTYASGDNIFQGCLSLIDVYAPKMAVGAGAYIGCTSLVNIVYGSNNVYTSCFSGCSNLKTVDFRLQAQLFRASIFNNCSSLQTLILRGETLTTNTQTNIFSGTPFDSGGTGGTIYIPKVLYDHLGDGSSLDYKSATNWSTLDGYGTITWAQIEGSEYEHYYADGRGVLQDITQNLTNCTINNDLAHYHTEFVTQIVPDDGYTTISNVSVSMNGVDITSSAYDATSRTITIDSPDGEIIINATGGV